MKPAALSPLLTQAAARALDLLLPPRCLSCGSVVIQVHSLCPTCWKGLRFLSPPQCYSCGLPFDHELPAESLCGGCLRKPPLWTRARAALAYDTGSKGMILRFKHADYTQAAITFAIWMERAAGPLLTEADIVAPVPLHRWRLFRRRYNQAALLASNLARRGGRRAIPDLLLRKRNTPSQGNLTARQRQRNVAGAFAVLPRWQPAVKDARILLVDDVFTSGATLDACSKVLYRAGAERVEVVTLARVLRPAPDR